MRLHFLKHTWIFLGVAALVTACGGRLESRNSGLQGPGAGPGTGTGTGTGTDTGNGSNSGDNVGANPKTFLDSSLKCVLEVPSAATRIRVFVDTQLHFYQGFEPPAFPLRVFAGKGGQQVPFEVLTVLADPAQVRAEAAPTQNQDGSVSVLIRGLQIGILPVGVSVRNGTEVTTCGTSFIIEGAPAPVPAVVTRANGVEGALPIPLSTGESVRISWTSANTRQCILSQDGGAASAIPLTGEVTAGPFLNAGTAVANHVFTVSCLGLGSTEVRSSTVTVPVNPVPTLSFNQVGGTALAKVVSGANVDVEWSSQFATGGCIRQEGNGGPVMVATSGTYRRANVTADLDLKLTCKDRNAGTVTKTVQVRLVHPAIAITANNVSGTFTKPVNTDVVIKWTGTDVNSCAVTPGNYTGIASQVTLPSAQVAATTTYTVKCQSAIGELTASVTVVVPIVTTTVNCSSGGYKYQECAQPGTILSINSVQKISASSCINNFSYGFKNGNVLWTNYGCRANFNITYRPY